MAKIENWLVYKIADKALSEVIKRYTRGKLLDIRLWGKAICGNGKPLCY